MMPDGFFFQRQLYRWPGLCKPAAQTSSSILPRPQPVVCPTLVYDFILIFCEPNYKR